MYKVGDILIDKYDGSTVRRVYKVCYRSETMDFMDGEMMLYGISFNYVNHVYRLLTPLELALL